MAERPARRRVQHAAGGLSRTKQSDALSSDINSVLERWIVHGRPPGAEQQAQYADFTNVDDYHTALNTLREAEASFARLPAAVRKHVDNDPGKFLDLVYNPDRRGELEELGMLPTDAPEAAPPAADAVKDTPPETPPAT